MLLSILFNFVIAKILSKGISKKIIISILGIIMNISLLAYPKYYNFFIENIDLMLVIKFVLVGLALPLAISFFTFQQIAYLADIYIQEIKEFDFLNYTIFVTFSPQLIAGPSVHHKEMMPQFIRIKNKFINFKNITLVLSIFLIGLFKKVVIADYFTLLANKKLDNKSILNFYESWITSLFNINLSVNYNSPYKALSMKYFWRRGLITISRFLRGFINKYNTYIDDKSSKFNFERLNTLTYRSDNDFGDSSHIYKGTESMTLLVKGLIGGVIEKKADNFKE